MVELLLVTPFRYFPFLRLRQDRKKEKSLAPLGRANGWKGSKREGKVRTEGTTIRQFLRRSKIWKREKLSEGVSKQE